jgi:hypothetical protein
VQAPQSADWRSKPVIDVARMYLPARQNRTLMVSLGMPADVHEMLSEIDGFGFTR